MDRWENFPGILMLCSVEHVYDLVKSGEICYIKDGRNVRFKPEDLIEK